MRESLSRTGGSENLTVLCRGGVFVEKKQRTSKADVEVSERDFGRTFWQFTVCLFNCFAAIDAKVTR